ncbi:MAG TPA: tetratricopeptide repeat protein [Holophagaceae bacterium]|nr:tetratricopeptide repeat protein [Holophagaceae bacterium]
MMALLMPASSLQAPAQTLLPPGEPTPPGIAELEKAGNWTGLADRFETFSPQQRGALVDLWMRSLNKAGRWERLVQVSEAVNAQLDAKSGRPTLSPARFYRAQALSQLGRHRDAYAAWSEIGTLGTASGFVNAAEEARQIGSWDDLLNQSEALLKVDPRNAAALGWKGEAMAKLEAYGDAEPVLRSALALDPKQPFAWSNLARCLNERKAWQESLEACSQALAQSPAMMEAHFNRGRALFELKRYAEARDDFRAALAAKPGDVTSTENLRQAELYAKASKTNR